MFNALNRFMSRLDGDATQQRQQEQGSFGFQVLRNTNLELAIEPWFDFIVGINGRPIVRANPPQSTAVRSNAADWSRRRQTRPYSRRRCAIVLEEASP